MIDRSTKAVQPRAYTLEYRETGEYRLPKEGEWYVNGYGVPKRAEFTYETLEFPILTEHFYEEVQPRQDFPYNPCDLYSPTMEVPCGLEQAIDKLYELRLPMEWNLPLYRQLCARQCVAQVAAFRNHIRGR